HSQITDLRPFIRNWLFNTEQGQAWLAQRNLGDEVSLDPPPEETCGPDAPRPVLEITSPTEGSVEENVVVVRGTVDAPNFSHYRVEFGVSHDPIGWGVVQGDTSQAISNGVLGMIDLSNYEDGPMTMRLIVYDTEGHRAERRVHFYLEEAEPTPTPQPEHDEPRSKRGKNRRASTSRLNINTIYRGRSIDAIDAEHRASRPAPTIIFQQ